MRHEATEIKHGKEVPVKTTKGWKICVRWKDGSTAWLPLKDVKESNPIQLAEYAVANEIDHLPAFKWWVKYTLKKRDRILKKMVKRYFRTHQKYGMEVPKTVERALEIDKENGNTEWRDAIRKEMTGIAKVFKILETDEPIPPGHELLTMHCVFDRKLDMTAKARYVADGHKTSELPFSMTYASVVSRESVRIAFLVAALNGLEVEAADIQQAYLNAPC